MVQWEYLVQVLGVLDHPYHWQHVNKEGEAKAMEQALMALGKEGWELVHVKEVKGDWRSSPEAFPGGDPGRMVWDGGRTFMYFKRLKGEGS